MDKLRGFARGTELAAVQVGRDILRGFSRQGDFHIVDDPGPVQGKPRKDAPLEGVDDDGVKPDLYRVRPHPEQNGPAGLQRGGNGRNGLAEIAGREDRGQRIEKRPHGRPRRPRSGKIAQGDLALPVPETCRLQALQLYGFPVGLASAHVPPAETGWMFGFHADTGRASPRPRAAARLI